MELLQILSNRLPRGIVLKGPIEVFARGEGVLRGRLLRGDEIGHKDIVSPAAGKASRHPGAVRTFHTLFEVALLFFSTTSYGERQEYAP